MPVRLRTGPRFLVDADRGSLYKPARLLKVHCGGVMPPVLLFPLSASWMRWSVGQAAEHSGPDIRFGQWNLKP